MAKKKGKGLKELFKLALTALRIYGIVKLNSASKYRLIIQQLNGMLGELSEIQNTADVEIDQASRQIDYAISKRDEALTISKHCYNVADNIRGMNDTDGNATVEDAPSE